MGPTGPWKQAWVERPQRITQDCQSWCWAASAAMIFAMNGHPTSQETIVGKVLNGMPCQTAMPAMVTDLLSREWIDNNQTSFRSKVAASYDIVDGIINIDNRLIIHELENDRPLLYANRHHAMVVVAIGYFDTPWGPDVRQVGVLDPWPPNPAYRFLSPTEMLAAHKGGEYSYLAAVRLT